MTWKALHMQHNSRTVPMQETYPQCPYCEKSNEYKIIAAWGGRREIGMQDFVYSADYRGYSETTYWVVCKGCDANIGVRNADLMIEIDRRIINQEEINEESKEAA